MNAKAHLGRKTPVDSVHLWFIMGVLKTAMRNKLASAMSFLVLDFFSVIKMTFNRMK